MKAFILEDNVDRIKFFRWFLRGHEIYITDDVFEAEKIFEEKAPFDYIFLDHDLDGQVYVPSTEENTGYRFAKYLKTKDLGDAVIIIHSYNPAGADNIQSVLPESHKIPFPLLAQQLINKEIIL